MPTKKVKPTAWRNRIVGHDRKPASWFLLNPDNWKIHPLLQAEALDDLLSKVGWVGEVVVNKRTSEKWTEAQRNKPTLVDGHLRVQQALRRGKVLRVPLVYVDLEPDEERLVLVTMDPIGTMAQTDDEKLGELLAGMAGGEDPINQMLGDLSREADMTSLQDIEEDGAPGGRDLGDRNLAIKPVIRLDELSTFEKAIQLTGESNRGKAILTICSFYIEQAGGK